jgi:hypothetical protein
MNPCVCVSPDVTLGTEVKLSKFINLYGCEIGMKPRLAPSWRSRITPRSENAARVQPTRLYAKGVTIEDNRFIERGVTFINDRYPLAATATGELQTEAAWKV